MMKETLFLAWMALMNAQTGQVEEIRPYGDHNKPLTIAECSALIEGKSFKLVDGKAVFLVCHRAE